MSTALVNICRQLRLAHIVETVKERDDTKLEELVEDILTTELEGRKRAKLGKLVNTAGFPHLKTFDGYNKDDKALLAYQEELHYLLHQK